MTRRAETQADATVLKFGALRLLDRIEFEEPETPLRGSVLH